MAGLPTSMLGTGILTFFSAAVTSFWLTPVAIRIAHRWGVVDRPGPRKIHKSPIPRIGGVAIFCGFLVGVISAAITTGYVNLMPSRTEYWGTLAGAATGMLILGFVDDVFGVSPRGKFAAQTLAALAAWAAGFRISLVSHPFEGGALDLGWLSLPITVLWIVGITNAINLIDGLDGLAAGCALITTTAIAVIAIHGDRVAVSAISVALVGSLVGFLRYNFNPARIFLGDSGSMFLGFVLAVISIHGSQKGPVAVAVVAPLLVLGVPILDTALAIGRRLHRIRKESAKAGRGPYWALRNLQRIFHPDREHLHHQLLDLGLGHRTVVLVLYSLMLVFGLLALAVVILNSVLVALVLVSVLAVGLGALLIALVRARRCRRANCRVEPEREGGLQAPPSPVGQI